MQLVDDQKCFPRQIDSTFYPNFSFQAADLITLLCVTPLR